MNYKFYTDPGHGWLEVPLKELLELNISQNISKYSYISSNKQFVYLEEDCDAPRFLEAKKKAGQEVKIEEVNFNVDCYIRRMKSFNLFAF